MVDMEINEIDEDQILREVWDTKNIDTKTELTDAQIEVINKSQTLAQLFGSDVLFEHINDFMRLQKSRNRKSMEEFTGIVKARKDPGLKDASIMGKLLG